LFRFLRPALGDAGPGLAISGIRAHAANMPQTVQAMVPYLLVTVVFTYLFYLVLF
jgi:hypothetical protein